MNNEFSLKEIEDVLIKATYPIEIGKRTIQTGEVIAAFDKLMFINFTEFNEHASARGGFDNREHICWDTTKEVRVSFSQGIFSPEQLTLLINCGLIDNGNTGVTITNRELLESDENNQIELKETPSGSIFVYEVDSGDKIEYTISGKKITVEKKYTNYLVDYEWTYVDGAQSLKIGKKLLNGCVSLEGRTKVKEDITGQVKTGIIKIPKLKLLSNLSMRLGKDTIPQVGGFTGTAIPVGERGQQFAMELYLLEDNIDSDF